MDVLNGQPVVGKMMDTIMKETYPELTLLETNSIIRITNDLSLSDKIEAGTTSTTLTAKLPILNLGEYDLWLIRIEQYFLMTDYSLWEVILNGNKVLKRKIREVEQEYEPTTAEEKQDRRNEMKARGTLLMALPNKDQLKFHSYKDAKLLMEAIEKRYGGNKESKKVQRTLLKQQYENFSGSSSETMDQTFDRLQKLISQLEIQGETISQEDMNLKLLRSLPSEWKTHALIWRNKVEIETISLDDLYNNLKIYELELKDSTNTSQNSQNVAFVSSNSTNSNSSTNEADNTAYGVSTAHTQSSPTSGDNLSDAVICAFLASQPNSPQMSREDLEQIDPDDLEEMDLQWEMAMLTIRARRFIKRTGRQLDVNGKRVGFDRSKVECYNCHKYGHFARECRLPRNQEKREKENNRRTVTVETPNENALVAQDGIGGYDWSYQAEEEHPTNFALMAHTSSGSSSSSDSEVDSCSKSCVKAYATLKEQYDNLNSDYNKSQFNLVSYKAVIDKFKTGLGYNAASSTTASPAAESFSSWVEAMQEELLPFKLQKVWTLVDLPNGKRPIGTKWVFRNKKDERGIVVRNKERLVALGYTQKGIDYDEMDVKSAFLYGTIEEEVYVCQPLGFEDPHFLDKVYKVEKASYGLHQAPRAWSTKMSLCDEFEAVKTASTLIETNKALVKGEEAEAVDVHLYRSMIGSLMYLTAFRPDIMFVVLWIQNQMLDYGFNFMNTKIYIDNESTICIVKNLVFHSKTKHIEIRHHFIRDSYEKRLIQGRLMVYKCSGLYTSAIWIEVGRIGLLYAVGQKLVLSGIELVLPGKLSTAGLPLEEVLLGV
ncbi:ribonuclease H-like domain-containing protein [Tanacetum coccineum]